MTRPLGRRTLPATSEDWRILGALSLYRLFLVALLLGLYQSGHSALFFADIRPQAFFSVCVAYGVAALALLPPVLYRVPRMSVQAHIHFFTDLAGTLALVYLSGGVPGGLGILLLTPAVGCSLVLSPRMAVMQAAAATLAVFAEELFRQYPSRFEASDFTQTGLLGLVFFATNIAANAVAQRARKSELLVERVGSDLASLSRLSESIVEFMESGVMVIEDGRIRLLNVAARQMLRLQVTALGAPLEAEAPAIAAAYALWQANPSREPAPVNEGGENEVVPRFTRLGYQRTAPVLCLLDRADELRAQAQQMKLVALGRLYAGIAHEIRNPLSAISHAGQLLTESERLGDEEQKLLNMIERHAQRIDKIVRDVLRLSRRDAGAPGVIELKTWLQQAIAQYQEAHSQDARRIELADMPPALYVRFDPNHLQQVLGNLWDNSFEHAGGKSEVQVRLSGGRGPAGAPYLEIRDNGAGIAPPLRERVFEPFFTTAPLGTGLGLYLARELCDYNHAHLTHVPQAVGACFRLTFMPAEMEL